MRFKRTRILLLVLSLAAVIFILFAASGTLGISEWDNFDINKIIKCSRTSIIYDAADAELVRLHGAEDRVWAQLQTLPAHTVYAFVSAEDARFFEHEGIDVIRIAGAVVADIKAGGYVQGASTITQQLIKLSHLTSEKTISRKAEEAVLAYQMERRCTKEEILEMYLNYVYFGGGYYGIEAAARGYFGVQASELTLGQSALLAGILKSPSSYAPHLDYEASIGRRNHILKLMNEYGYISEAQKQEASGERPKIVRGTHDEYRGYYTDAVAKSAAAALNITIDELTTGGYRIYSAMDSALQARCEEIFQTDGIFPTEDCEAALVVQQQDTGLVSAMVGGRSYAPGMAFNRATDIRRQPGSVIKPVIAYAPALEYLDYTAATMVLDEETAFADYTPANFNDKYYGWVTVREAVTRSLNMPAIKILSEVGVERAKQFASSCGIEFDERDESLALALGGFTYGVSPMQVAGAYSCFSGGTYSAPSLVRYITDEAGNVLYEYKPQKQRVMSEANAYILTSMLKSVVSEGTGRRLSSLNVPIAGKTGTVGAGEGNRDAWMATYTPDYTAVVWMGYDSDADGTLPSGSTGGKYPALLLNELYGFIYPSGREGDFERPQGVEEYRIDTHTLSTSHRAVLANALTPMSSQMTELFTADTAPAQTTSYWSIPAAAQNLKASFANGQISVSFDCPDDFAVYMLCRRDALGSEKTLATWNGTKGHIEYADADAKAGESYEYRVLSRHTDMNVNGNFVYGLPTNYVEAKATEKVVKIKLDG